jgi:hypothetical protein
MKVMAQPTNTYPHGERRLEESEYKCECEVPNSNTFVPSMKANQNSDHRKLYDGFFFLHMSFCVSLCMGPVVHPLATVLLRISPCVYPDTSVSVAYEPSTLHSHLCYSYFPSQTATGTCYRSTSVHSDSPIITSNIRLNSLNRRGSLEATYYERTSETKQVATIGGQLVRYISST